MYEAVITPPLGSSMPGHAGERKAAEVLDDLYAKALVIDSNGHVAALVVVDALYVQRIEVQKIRERISRHTPIPPERVMVSATHSHSGPPIRPGFDGVDHPSYLNYMVERTADAVILAYNRRREARIGSGIGRAEGIAFNRRYWMKDGTVRTNPGFRHPDLVRPAGPADPELLVVRIEDTEGRPIGAVTNFACHTDTLGGGNLGLSADYPGELSRLLKRELGSEAVCLFVQGASGNMNHYDFTKPKSIEPGHYRVMGRKLADETMKVWRTIMPSQSGDLPISVRQAFFPIAYRLPTEAEADEAHRTLASEGATEKERYFAEHLLNMLNDPEKTAMVEVQTFRLGELAVVGLPGEIFAEFGLRLKRHSSYKYTMINTLCNGSIQGYVCTKEAYVQGGYESKLKRNHRIPSGAGDLFVEHALQGLASPGKEALESGCPSNDPA
jgi:hypothetical protein